MSWLYKRNDSDRWWMGYWHNGVQVLKSTGQEDKGEAKKVLDRIEAMLAAQRAGALTLELYQAISGRTVTTTVLKAALTDWLNEAEGATAPRTFEKYQSVADAITAHFHVTDRGPLVSDLTREQLQSFLTEKRATVKASTANITRKCLAVFFRRCKVHGAIRDNPMEGVKVFKAGREEKRARRPFTLTELSSLYQKAPDDFWRYMVLGGFFTGLRLGDLVTMPIGAVDFKAKVINLTTRKTGTPMHIPVTGAFLALLKKLNRPDANPTEPFWPEHAARYEQVGPAWYSQRFYDLVLVKAGLVVSRPHRTGTKSKSEKRKVNEVSFHCFRHSMVSTLAGLGQNQQIVKALAGHSGDQINDLYTRVPASVLKSAVALLPDITRGTK